MAAAVVAVVAVIFGSVGALVLASRSAPDADRVRSAGHGSVSVVLDGPTSDVTARLTPHPNGDLEIEYRRGGEAVFHIVERHECAGLAAGTASWTETEDGVVLRGILPHGATGVSVTTIDGRSITGEVWSSPDVVYPYFEMHTGTMPNWDTFQALGVDRPPPCITPPSEDRTSPDGVTIPD